MRIGLFIAATGKYEKYIPRLIESAERFFLSGHTLKYFVFTDRKDKWDIQGDIHLINETKKEWPYSTLMRPFYYSKLLLDCGLELNLNYCFAIDADALFYSNVGNEILGNITAVQHCAYVNLPGPGNNGAKIHPYYGGGFYGGRYSFFQAINRQMMKWIDAQKEIPEWHDETALNHVLQIYKPDIVLSPSYHYPIWGPDDELNPYIARIWQEQKQHIYETYGVQPPFTPKIIMLDKQKDDPGGALSIRS